MIKVIDDSKPIHKGAKQYSSMGDVSDGYHTFDELYEFRMLYNAAFFNELAAQANITGAGKQSYLVHKSWKHSDGELCFGGGWFVVVAQLPTGQVSNHYQAEHWDLFNVPAMSMAAPWDGHTPQDVINRLRDYLSGTSNN